MFTVGILIENEIIKLSWQMVKAGYSKHKQCIKSKGNVYKGSEDHRKLNCVLLNYTYEKAYLNSILVLWMWEWINIDNDVS